MALLIQNISFNDLIKNMFADGNWVKYLAQTDEKLWFEINVDSFVNKRMLLEPNIEQQTFKSCDMGPIKV